ncbi:hypothetical protein MAC_00933 [Metarhizium acridum CQMa 102]|uniref:Uncharacterized protein n=1 Tax=Metarhizium acridum (strain CQMa 102) TaxID=655827 RepID=E9DT51_METAQ|nr:uncharacterized protein MAC_00933 [Metarhizium acridum CQMa 102]EFY93150.1 hypothetical protein MAC_00933 [Metarhizium acridum CQMa 102]
MGTRANASSSQFPTSLRPSELTDVSALDSDTDNNIEGEAMARGRVILTSTSTWCRTWESNIDEGTEYFPEDSAYSDLDDRRLKGAERQRAAQSKGVPLGTWIDSQVLQDDRKHAVTGFIDTVGLLQTHVLPETKHGESLAEEYPLPPGSGRCWIRFSKIKFSKHLHGLDHLQIKEYIRILSEYREAEGRIPGDEEATVQAAKYRLSKDPNWVKSKKRYIEYSDPECELAQVRPFEAAAMYWGRAGPLPIHSLNCETRARESQWQGVGFTKEANVLAHGEIGLAQKQADGQIMDRGQAVEAAAATPSINRQMVFREWKDIQRLDKACPLQETPSRSNSIYSAKIYNGIKYERQTTGAFIGKLVSQGVLINIAGEDYLEHRVLAMPGFC